MKKRVTPKITNGKKILRYMTRCLQIEKVCLYKIPRFDNMIHGLYAKL